MLQAVTAADLASPDALYAAIGCKTAVPPRYPAPPPTAPRRGTNSSSPRRQQPLAARRGGVSGEMGGRVMWGAS